MPREIKLLLPDINPNDYLDILIQSSQNNNSMVYRFEIWDSALDNPMHLKNAEYLRQKIHLYENEWETVEIFAAEGNKIPILFIQKQAH